MINQNQIHILEHQLLGLDYCGSTKRLKIGSGRNFATLTDALGAMQAVGATASTVTTTGNVTCTQFSDRVTFATENPRTLGIRPGDFMYVPNDAQTLGYSTHHYYVIGVMADAVILETGIIGATQTFSGAVFKRLNRFLFDIAEGEFDTARYILPDGYWTSFIGQGDSSVLTGQAFETPAWGYMEFANLDCSGAVVTGGAKNHFPLIGASMPTVRARNLTIGATDFTLGAPDIEFLDGVCPSGVHLTNINYLNVIDHGIKLNADSIFVDGFTAHMAEQSYECIQTGNGGSRANTKPKIFMNVEMIRRGDGALGTVGQIIANIGAPANSPEVEYRFSNVFARDAGASAGACIQISGSDTGTGVPAKRVYVSNANLENASAVEISSAGTSVTVLMDRCFRKAGGAIRTSGTSTFTTL
jgi:hypothetical protein